MGRKQVILVGLGIVLGALHLYKPTLATAIEGVASSVLVLGAVFVHKPGAAAYIAELEAVIDAQKKGGGK